MAAKRPAKKLTVSAKKQITQNMLRLTLKGADLNSFPDNASGAYFKLVFEDTYANSPIMRTYTVANYRKNENEIDVDFMLHASANGVVDGVAAPWAMQAKVGDPISIFGPGPATFINLEADWFLLAADMTALPALTNNIPLLPENATGYVVIEILSAEDKQDLQLPENMEMVWVVNPQPGSDSSPLLNAIKNVKWLDKQVAVWTACEFKTMKKVRQYYRENRSIEKPYIYISSYWKKGLTEEEHKVAKQEESS